jgi:hypothetical protein
MYSTPPPHGLTPWVLSSLIFIFHRSHQISVEYLLSQSQSQSQSQSYVTTEGQPASLSRNKAPICGLWPDFYYLCDSYGLDLVRRPLWGQVGSIFCNCSWSSPAQSFLGPSAVGLVTIFCCLKFETSLFFASYDSQGHGGGIRPRLHTGQHLLTYFSHTYKVPAEEHRKHRFHGFFVSSIPCWFIDVVTC